MTNIFRRHLSRLALPVLVALPMTLSCARLPPGSTGLSGKRLHVVMRFASAIEPNFFYYFLINKYGPTGTSGARGPIPVLSRNPNYGYGNGFATGSQGGVGTINGITDYGITDYVLYHTGAPNAIGSIGFFHFPADPNVQPATYISMPRNVVLPDNSATADPAAANTLSFDVYVSQLVTDTTSSAAIVQEAQNIQFLQVNIVATNLTPTDPTTDVPSKQVDAMGDGRSSSQQEAYLQIDLSQNKTYTSSDSIGFLLPEPQDDVYPGGSTNKALDLISWSITIIPSS